jgi:uncharacterized protein (TIGR02466 family)
MGEDIDEGSARPGLMREFYFPTPIYFSDLPGARSLNEAIKPPIYAWRAEDQEGIHRSNVKRVGSWHSQLDMHRREEYRPLTEQILGVARQIFDDLGYDPVYEPAIDNMWANISPRYGYNRSHIHPNVLWSGVYYVQAPPDGGRIYFTDPRAQVLILTPRYAPDAPRKAEAWSEVYYEAIEGRLILFPSWLAHEVEPNLCDREGPAGDRISISFNLYQKRRQAS